MQSPYYYYPLALPIKRAHNKSVTLGKVCAESKPNSKVDCKPKAEPTYAAHGAQQ
jgi:hypothetical protein